MKEIYVFEQLSEIYQILHINPEDKDSHIKHSEAAIAVLRERIDQACKGEIEEYKTQIFGVELADQYLMKSNQLERYIESLKIITPHFNDAIDTFHFEVREEARLKKAEERARIRREKMVKYGTVWGLI